jgi:hypothetical protein
MTEDISNSFPLNRMSFWEHRFCEVCEGVFALKLENEVPSTEEETAESRSKNRHIAKMVLKQPCICNRGL